MIWRTNELKHDFLERIRKQFQVLLNARNLKASVGYLEIKRKKPKCCSKTAKIFVLWVYKIIETKSAPLCDKFHFHGVIRILLMVRQLSLEYNCHYLSSTLVFCDFICSTSTPTYLLLFLFFFLDPSINASMYWIVFTLWHMCNNSLWLFSAEAVKLVGRNLDLR